MARIRRRLELSKRKGPRRKKKGIKKGRENMGKREQELSCADGLLDHKPEETQLDHTA